MASRTPTRRRAGGRSSSRSKQNNQMPMIIGGGGLLVLILILVMVNSGGGGDETNDADGTAPAKQPANQPEQSPSNVPVSSGSAGKTPDRAAPLLTQATLGKMQDLLIEATAISDAGMKMLGQGENMASRRKQSEAKVKVDQIKNLIEEQSGWFEEADMGGWSIPSEYVTMNNIYAKVSKLEKRIRMQGGK
ncbi:MAG: hypothetical protein ACI8UD_003398 [Planctomycetota bacterium]|jgi:hypothetical protein